MIQIDRVCDDRCSRIRLRGRMRQYGQAVRDAEAEAAATPAARRDAANRLAGIERDVSVQRIVCVEKRAIEGSEIAEYADAVCFAVVEMQRDVATVVDERARDACLRERIDQFICDATGNR